MCCDVVILTFSSNEVADLFSDLIDTTQVSGLALWPWNETHKIKAVTQIIIVKNTYCYIGQFRYQRLIIFCINSNDMSIIIESYVPQSVSDVKK